MHPITISNYGAECAEFLFSDEITLLKDMEDSIIKSTIESQILAMPNNWQLDFLNVETGVFKYTVVEPEVKLRIINIRIMEEKRACYVA